MNSDSTTAGSTVEQAERSLRALPGILEARVLEIGEGAERIAYVAGPGALSPLPAGFAQRHHLGHVVPVARLGQAAALAALPIWDAEALGRLATGFRRRTGVSDVAVATIARSRPRFLPRSCLSSPGNAAGDEDPQPPRRERATIGARLSERPAFAGGGPLHLPAGHPATLGEALERAAGTGRGIRYLAGDGGERRETYDTLRRRALAILGGLREAGARRGDLLLLDSGDAACFLGAFWACMLGGLVPVPIALPAADADPAAFQRLRAVWVSLDRPRLLAGTSTSLALAAAGPETAGMAVLNAAGLEAAAPAEPTPSADPDETAVIILTSGSTGTPKGVCQRHRALLAMSVAAGIEGMGLGEADVFFNWMPLDHVGGIVFQMILPVILGCEQLHSPTAPILADPARWPEIVSRHRVTVSWAPNFAFGLIADAVAGAAAGSDDRGRLWDLSCLRALANGGEAVTENSLERFLDCLAPSGLARSTLRPTFGMSETCTAITLASLGHAIGPFASLGSPVAGSALRIVGEEGQVLKEGEIGKLQLMGPQVFAGYYGRDDLTEAARRDGWFETGDVGFLASGQLYLTGRSKDSININGAKLFAHEIEATAARTPGIEQANLAAVAVRPPGARTEQVALFFSAALAESGDEDVLRALLIALRARLAGELGLATDYLLPVPAQEIPRTSIGKIVRPTLKQRFEAGAYDSLVERVAGLLGGPRTLPVSLHRRIWVERPVEAAGGSSPVRLVLAGQELDLAGLPASAASSARQPARDSEGYRALLSASTGEGGTILHLCGEDDGESPYRSLLALAQAIAGLPAERRPEGVLAVTTGALHAEAGDPVDPWRALLPGLIRSLNLEVPDVRWRLADVASADLSSLPDILAGELTAGGEPLSAWRSGRRWVPRFEAVTPAPAAEPAVGPGDLWLVTGGLGGIGRAASARLLARGARLLLVGRTQRAGLAAEREADLQRLEGLGWLRYAAVDVGDPAALGEAVAGIEAEAGCPLAGILHLAGVGRPVPLLEDAAEELPQMRRAALDGLASLHGLLATRPQACLTVAGSIVGAVGGHVVGYAAVNAAAAEASTALIEAGARVSHLAFSSWIGVGLSEGRTSEALLRADGLLPLDEETGLAVLEAASRRPGTCWLVGLDEDHPLHAALTLGEPAPLTRPVAWIAGDAATGAERHPDALGRPAWLLLRRVDEIARHADGTPDLTRLAAGDSGRRRAPRDETERRVAEVFGEVLSLEAPAADDDFFLAGGSSLLATRLAARLSQRFLVELPVGAVFRHPTVEGLTRQLRAIEPKPGLVDAVARQLAVLESLSTEERAMMQAQAGG